MNRAELQRLAGDRILDAQALLAAGRWSGAYHLAGYAVECGLKSCILAHLDRTGRIFTDRNYLNDLAKCWTHNFDNLLKLADLTAEFGKARAANPRLEIHWTVVRDWEETSRYEQRSQAEAEELHEAITNDPDGVLRWIRNYW